MQIEKKLEELGLQLPPPPPEQEGFHPELPPPALQPGTHRAVVGVKGEQLPVSPGAVGAGAGQIAHRLQQVGLALGVFAVDDVDAAVKVHF